MLTRYNDFADFIEFVEFVKYAKRCREVGPKRYLRDHSDPFTKYSAKEFHARYRFTTEAVKKYIIPILESDLQKPTNRGLPFAPEIMVLITLRFYATGSFQKLDREIMDICKQSVKRIIFKVSSIIASKMKDFVKYPATAEEINKVKQNFYEIDYFPEVIGCLGCTHIKIKSPGGNTAKFYKNNKRWFSINVQAVTGPNLEFFDLIAQPGGSYISYLNSSDIKYKFDSGVLSGIILGESGYELSNVLMTPFSSPNNEDEELYNKSHMTTRNTVEKALAVWKRRFQCLQIGMIVNVKTVVDVICACATLHNISVMLKDVPAINIDKAETSLDNNIFNSALVPENPSSNGFLLRQSLVENFFS